MRIAPYSDQKIVKAILDRDSFITKESLNNKCYPMLNTLHSRYDTAGKTTINFISNIYIYVLSIEPKTDTCKLAELKFTSVLYSWLEAVSLSYCYSLSAKKVDIDDNFNTGDDRISIHNDSIDRLSHKENSKIFFTTVIFLLMTHNLLDIYQSDCKDELFNDY